MRFGALFFLLALAIALDPYKVLDISKDADEKTIKSAYRRLSKQYHPDKNSDPEAHDRFIEIGQAYEILSDAEKKLNYDRFGDADPHQGGGGANFDFGDLFNQFFQHGHNNHHGQRQRRGPDTQVRLLMPLRDFYVGRDFGFDVEMNNVCQSCSGSGSADGERHRCSRCGGSGVILTRRQMGPMIQQFQTPCDQCGGKGTTIAKPCKTCRGQGTERKQRHYNVYFSPGTARNSVKVLEGEGDQSPDWVPGNMNLVITEETAGNWGFHRVGNHLYRTEVISAKEALEGGWQREIRLFDEETVVLKRGKGEVVMDGHVDVIKEHGMPHDDDYGHMYVEYRVVPIGKSNVKVEL